MTPQEARELAGHVKRTRSRVRNGVPHSQLRETILAELDHLMALAGPHLVAAQAGRARSLVLHGVPPSRVRDDILHELDHLAALAGPHLVPAQATADGA
ncbi:MAG TPA: hypothetical protein VGS19_29215 [Streptosporangiaceae bacterium]|nr:hypothetical protein [Streptosporangiaceae bacterium]